MKILYSILLFLILALPQIAFAQWEDAFPTENTQSYFAQDRLVMVVSVNATDASRELIKGIGNKAISGDSLGDVSTLSDEEIVKKAKAQPVEKVVIVRLAGEGTNAIAIVTIYKTEGSAAGGFTASKSAPVTRLGGEKSGASQKEFKSVNESVPKEEDNKVARKQFLDNYVGFVDRIGVNQYGGIVSQRSEPYKGRDRLPLKGADFYEAIDRNDLAGEYRSTTTVKVIGILVSSGALVASVVAGVQGGLSIRHEPYDPLIFGSDDPEDAQAELDAYDAELAEYKDSDPASWFAVSGGLFVLGMVGLITSIVWNPHPVGPAEARRLARLYNEKLAEDLGLDIESLGRSEIHAPAPPTELRIGFSPNRDGASVNVGFTF